jgi:hypothetical protein
MDNDNSNPKKNETLNWKEKFHDLVQVCQNEIKRTTAIGKKMLSASQSNSDLNDHYCELGRLAYLAIQDGKIAWADEQVQNHLTQIERLEIELKEFEEEVKKIKQGD